MRIVLSCFRLLLVAAMCIVIGGCNSPSRTSAVEMTKLTRGPIDLGEITYDQTRPSSIPTAKVQVLIDSSASMAGFSSIASFLHAIDQGLSYSRDLYFRVESQRTCAFNQTNGIFSCQARIDGAQLPRATGYTNLDRAVAATSDFDLSIIVTDGVPAGSGSVAENHCVGSGVDAACVADALSEAVQGAPGSRKNRIRGVWIAPIIAPYKGTFFAEQRISPRDFNANSAEDTVRTAFGVNTKTENARTSSDGTLVFDYEGPRYLLGIVIGDLNIGRAFLQELYSKSDFSNITKLQNPKTYSGGTAFLPPIEVFPSALPEQSYSSCEQERDVRHRIVGGLVNCRVSEPNRLSLSCGKSARTKLELSSSAPAEVMRLRPIAPVVFQMNGGEIVTDIGIPIGSRGSPHVFLSVSCDGAKRIACGSAAASTQLATVPDFQAAADAISSGKTSGGRLVQRMSTRSPASDPAKVYGLADLLQNFYRRQLPQGAATFALLEVCQE